MKVTHPIVGDSGRVTLNVKEQLIYTSAVIHEAMRLHTVVALGVAHTTTCDTSLGKLDIVHTTTSNTALSEMRVARTTTSSTSLGKFGVTLSNTGL